MKVNQFRSLIREVITEMGYDDRDVQLYQWIQWRLKRETRPDKITALKTVAGMLEKEKGGVLTQEPPIRGFDQ